MARYKVQLQIIDLNFLFDFRGLADMNGDGQMDINEFSIACKLITNKLKGKPIHIIMQYLASLFQSYYSDRIFYAIYILIFHF